MTPKSRLINDLHHAKDAYLNIVVGNVYHECFTKRWFDVNSKYSLKTKTLFTHNVKVGDNLVWDSETDLPCVKKTYNKNNAHLTRYAFCKKSGQNGGFFDQNPCKKGEGLISLKKGRDTLKYGGYDNSTTAFFSIVKYDLGNKKQVSFVPVDLMVSEKFKKDADYAREYCCNRLQDRNKKTVSNVEIKRSCIKIKIVISLDGFKYWLNGKADRGKRMIVSIAESAVYSNAEVAYIKKLENYSEKKKKNSSIMHDEVNDGLSVAKNVALYDKISDKLNSNLFGKLPSNQRDTLLSGRDSFVDAEFDMQVALLLTLVNMLKSGRSGGCDLSLIGGSPNSGVLNIGAEILSSKFSDIRIIDVSPSGLHEKSSINLKEL